MNLQSFQERTLVRRVQTDRRVQPHRRVQPERRDQRQLHPMNSAQEQLIGREVGSAGGRVRHDDANPMDVDPRVRAFASGSAAVVKLDGEEFMPAINATPAYVELAAQFCNALITVVPAHTARPIFLHGLKLGLVTISQGAVDDGYETPESAAVFFDGVAARIRLTVFPGAAPALT
jgi:hypothetical protein